MLELNQNSQSLFGSRKHTNILFKLKRCKINLLSTKTVCPLVGAGGQEYFVGIPLNMATDLMCWDRAASTIFIWTHEEVEQQFGNFALS